MDKHSPFLKQRQDQPEEESCRPARESTGSDQRWGNVWLLILHQIIFRVGWTFKTESVVLPGFLDFLIGPGAGVYRGFLPILNRLGQGLVPVFLARLMGQGKRRQGWLVGTTLLLALAIFLTALLAREHRLIGGVTAAVLFLTLYFFFSAGYGLYMVAFNTVQGKLVRADYRGRLMSYATFWGTIPAVLVAWVALRPWLAGPNPWYEVIFFASACLFSLSGLICALLKEPRDGSPPANPSSDFWQSFRNTLWHSSGFRTLWLAAMVYSFSLALIPHYQAFARDRLHISSDQQYLWVIAQSVSVGIFSILVGWLADRYGNRLTFALLVFCSVLPPAWCLILLNLTQQLAEVSVWFTFVSLAFTTLAPRLAINYALELVAPDEHAVATAGLQLSLTLPLLASPLWGWLIEYSGFEMLLLGAILITLLAGGMSFLIPEPRREFAGTPPPKILAGDE